VIFFLPIFLGDKNMENQYEIDGDTIEVINFNGKFTDEFKKYLVKNKKITFDSFFNSVVDEWPEGIEKIRLGFFFDNILKNLPSSLKKLEIQGKNFNHPLDNLPLKLEVLNLRNTRFNQPLENLPDSLKKIYLPIRFNQSLDFLPYGVEVLRFQNYSHFSHSFDNLPPTIIKLEIPAFYPQEINNLPDSIEELFIGVRRSYTYDNQKNYTKEVDLEIYPAQKNFKMITRFPKNLKKMYIFDDYKYIDELKEKLGDKLIIIHS